MKGKRVWTTVFIFISAMLTTITQADPRQWGTQGVPLRQGTYLHWRGQRAQDDAGRTLVVWSDTRTHDRDIYAQLISPTGETEWDSGGVSVVSENHTQRDAAVCSSDGEWIIAWIDQRDTSHLTVWAQRLNATGNRLWSIEGVPIDAGESQLIDAWTTPFIADDGAGGAMIVWQGYVLPEGPISIYAQHINTDGASVWPDPLEILDTGSFSASAADAEGNLYVEYAQESGDSILFRCVKITATGATPWGAPGVVVAPYHLYGEEYATGMISADGAGGCYLMWNGGAQHIGGNGQMMWPAPLIFEPHFLRALAALDSAGQPSGCVMVTATNYYYFVEQDLIAQKYAPGGEALWGANGQVFYTGYTYDPVAQSDKQGGAVIAWRGENTSDYGIRAVRFNSQGTNLWTMTDPQVISPTADNASLSILVNLQRCALFFMTGFAENEFTVRFPFLAQQQLNMTTGEAQFSDTGQVLAGGITGWTDGIGIIEMSDVRMAVVWTDSRDNNNIRPAYFQIFDSTGQAQLTENGERLLSVVDTALYSAWDDYVTDGAGGFFCLFHDYQDEWQLRLTRRDATGTQIGGPHGGLVSEDGGWGPSSGFLCSDDSGGCYVAWTDRHIWSQNRKYVMRMNANCQPMWADPLPIIPSDPANNYVNDLIPTSDDGFIVLSGTRITKVLGNAALWTQVITNSSAHVELAADTAGGVFVSWNTNFGQDAKLQHYDAAGAAWGNSIPFNSEGWHTYANSLIPDLLGGVYAVWHRQMNGEVPDEIWAQRVAVNGELLWPDLGIMILDRPDTWVIASVGTGSGNLFVAWEDNDNATVLRGRLIAPDGSIPDVWWQPEEGGLICDSMDTWSHVSVASLGEHDAGLVFTPWSDDEYMGGDLRVQRLNLEIVTGTNTPAVLPLEYVLYQNYPNPFNPVTRIAFELLRASEVELDIFDILGRHVVALVHEPMEAGRHQANFDASELASGIYFYRLKAGDFVQCRKMVVLK